MPTYDQYWNHRIPVASVLVVSLQKSRRKPLVTFKPFKSRATRDSFAKPISKFDNLTLWRIFTHYICRRFFLIFCMLPIKLCFWPFNVEIWFAIIKWVICWNVHHEKHDQTLFEKLFCAVNTYAIQKRSWIQVVYSHHEVADPQQVVRTIAPISYPLWNADFQKKLTITV